ncbi:MAG: VOC family protein [Bacteroidetes bacterium]|nr:VOC family protein [Bacteroidota bacterium]
MNSQEIKTSIAPWLSVSNSRKAVEFYKAAFNAVEAYHLDVPNGVIARLSIQGAEFWVSDGSDDQKKIQPEQVGGETIRFILTIAAPEPIFQQALDAGATEIFPIGIDNGWKSGRLADPFGLHWEIGHPVDDH